MEVLEGDVDHREPLAGDNGYRFVQDPGKPILTEDDIQALLPGVYGEPVTIRPTAVAKLTKSGWEDEDRDAEGRWVGLNGNYKINDESERSEKIRAAEATSRQNGQANANRDFATRPMTEQEKSNRADMINQAAHTAEEQGYTTKMVYDNLHGVSGMYHPDRVSQQERAIMEPFEQKLEQADKGRVAIITGGLPGAGKTRMLADYGQQLGYDPSKFVTLNPDDVKEQMVQNGMQLNLKGIAPMETAHLIHEESSDLARRQFAEAVNQGANIVIDITWGGKDQALQEKYLDVLQKAGYKTTMAFVSTTPKQSLDSARNRWAAEQDKWLQGQIDPATRTPAQGGRLPTSSITRENSLPEKTEHGLGAGERSVNQDNFYKMLDQFDRAVLFDRSQGGAARPVWDTDSDIAAEPSAELLGTRNT